MTVLERLILGRRSSSSSRSASSDYTGALTLESAFGGMLAREGEDEPMAIGRALGLPAVFAAVRVLAEGVGSLPLIVYQRRRGGGRVRAFFDPAYRLLHDRPNPEMTPMDCWGLVATHLNTWGDAFVGKEFAPGGGVVRALWPIRPDLVVVRRIDGEKVYDVLSGDGRRRYTAKEIIHIRGLSVDGLVGVSPIQVARQSIGLGLSLDRHASALMRDRAVPQGAVKMRKPLTDPEARRRFRAEWDEIHKRRGRVAILDDGAEYQAITMPLGDVEFIEQQRFTVQQVARIFRLDPSMIGGSGGDSLTYKNIEADTLRFVMWSLRPWLVRIEQALAADTDLFPAQDGGLYCEFLIDAVLRADTLSRAKAWQIATAGAPWMTGAEVRDSDNLAPDPRFDVVHPPDARAGRAGAGEEDPTNAAAA